MTNLELFRQWLLRSLTCDLIPFRLHCSTDGEDWCWRVPYTSQFPQLYVLNFLKGAHATFDIDDWVDSDGYSYDAPRALTVKAYRCFKRGDTWNLSPTLTSESGYSGS